MKTLKINLNWTKIITKDDFDLSKDFLSNEGGIYIWIFNGKPQRATYIGEADNFTNRFVTHFSSIITGRWNTYDINEQDDFVEFLHKQYHGKYLSTIRQKDKCYIPNQPHNPDFSFHKTFFDRAILEIHTKYLDLLTFAFATGKSIQEDKNVRKQVEGILIKGLRIIYAKCAGVDQLRSLESRSYEIPIGNINRNPLMSYSISHGGDEVDQIPYDIKNIVGYDYDKKKIVFTDLNKIRL